MNTTIRTGDTRVLKNRTRLEGGVFSGVFETEHGIRVNTVVLEGGVFEGAIVTKRCVPDGYVVSIAVQSAVAENGQRNIQRSNYMVRGGKGVVL